VAGRGAGRVLAIEPGEGGDVARLCGLFFVLAFGYVVGQAAGYAFFVDRFGARQLPFAFLVMPLFGMGVTTLNLRVGARVGLPRLLVIDVAAMLAVGVAVWVCLGSISAAWLLFLLPVWDAGVNSMNNLVVWSASSRLLDVRQAKRLAPVISAGRSTALVVGGFLVPVIVHATTTRALYLVQVAAFASGLAIMASLVRRRGAALDSISIGSGRTSPSADGSPRRYLTAVFAVVFLSMLAYVLVRNIFLDRGAVQFPRPSDYAAQIGLFNACQGVATLLTGLLLSGRFLRRFGLRGGLIALPAALLVLCAPFVLLDLHADAQFALAATTFVVCGALMFSVRTPSVQLLYQPLEPHTRTRAVSTGDG
jgi:AAA family ATP:ADP antiporter